MMTKVISVWAIPWLQSDRKFIGVQCSKTFMEYVFKATIIKFTFLEWQTWHSSVPCMGQNNISPNHTTFMVTQIVTDSTVLHIVWSKHCQRSTNQSDNSILHQKCLLIILPLKVLMGLSCISSCLATKCQHFVLFGSGQLWWWVLIQWKLIDQWTTLVNHQCYQRDFKANQTKS